jgi:rifampicin phosphotransferase
MIEQRFVILESDLPHSSIELIGGKAYHLAQLRSLARMPPSFVITTAALRRMLNDVDSNPDVDSLPSIRRLLETAELPECLVGQIRCAAAEWFAAGTQLVVRSTAVTEDGDRLSFAGIYDSVLGVTDDSTLIAAIRQVWLSAFSPRAAAYRQQHGLEPFSIDIAVLVQAMIPTTAAGVCFTCDPASGSSKELVIHSIWGLAEGLLSRGFPCDCFYFHRHTGAIRQQLSPKPQLLSSAMGGGTQLLDVPDEQQTAPSLSLAMIGEIARIAVAIETYATIPQDIEFGVCGEELYVFQARSVTAVAGAPHPASGIHQVWDNSNIIESYSGVTTPMTFSFIRRAYSIVYRCFAEVMGISSVNVELHREAFDNMLGIFRGRVYYNLKNWYRLIRLFPGYQYNRNFMESMMGVKQRMTLDYQTKPQNFFRRWFIEFPALITLLARCALNFFRIRSIISRFEAHFDTHYREWATINFDDLPPERIAALYDTMEGKMLWNWKAPIINDFYVMVFFGVLKKLCQSWCHDATGTLQNGLVSGEGGLLSEAPARLLMQMTQIADDDPALKQILLQDELTTIPQLVANDKRFSDFQRLMQHFLDEFGLRSANELKLESRSYQDQPDRVYQLLRNYLQTQNTAIWNSELIRTRELGVRREAEHQAFAALRSKRRWWLRRIIFRWVLVNARRGIVNRENMRFSRTKIYGILRRMLRAMGRCFVQQQLLRDREDIFFLTLDEVWSYGRGTAVSADLQSLVDARQHEYSCYSDPSSQPLPNRFETYGLPYLDLPQSSLGQPQNAGSTTLQGIGCCPGVVMGTTQWVRHPHDVVKFTGKILVAEHTDPGWVPLFPAFAGILVERGSVLSHSAIVAREMGIPTIVGVAGLTSRLRQDQLVEMDGRSGVVRKVSPVA